MLERFLEGPRPYRSTAAREHIAEGYGRPETVTIDVHGHLLVPAADDLVRPHLPATTLDAVRYASPETRALNVKQNEERHAEIAGVERRLADMDRMGIDVMLLSPVPTQFNYAADPALAAEAAHLVNDAIAEAVGARPDRLLGLGTVPLQDTGKAIAELARCMGELGMKGIEVGAGVAGEELSAERLEPFWAEVEALGAFVMIHPTAFASERLEDHYFTNVIGNPLETTVAALHLVFAGVMERYPNLKIMLAHGGAYAAAYAARADHAWGARPDCRARLARPPSESLRRFHLDTIVFATDQLEFLARKFGPERLLLGTDYPFDMGEYDPIEHVLQTPGLDADAVAGICGLNAVRLLGLDPAAFGRADFERGMAR